MNSVNIQSSDESLSTNETEKTAARSVVNAIKLGVSLSTLSKDQASPSFFYGELDQLFQFTQSSSIFSVNMGVVPGDTLFTSTRDHWAKLRGQGQKFEGLPKVSGHIDESSEKPYIRISDNSDAGTDFNNHVLSTGVVSIRISESGQITGQDVLGGEMRALREPELKELTEIFMDGMTKLTAIQQRIESGS